MGEALFAQGAAFHVQAAGAFFKALKVYPAPLELVMIYQKAVPKEVFDLIMKLVARDAAANAAESAPSSAALDGVDDENPRDSAGSKPDSATESKTDEHNAEEPKPAAPESGEIKDETPKGEAA